MDLELTGRACLVTGASTGIGMGITRILAKEGARVAITARRTALLNRLADEIEVRHGLRPVVVPGDITRTEDVTRIVAEAETALGPIGILVNNAGGSRPARPDEAEQVWEEAFALNFTAARRMTEALLPGMRARGWGRIVNLSGSMEPRALNASTAAKASLHLWAKGLSCDVAAEGITVNSIAPGRISSEQTLERLHPTDESRRAFIARHIPIGYFGDPEDIGQMVAFLTSPLARYVTGAVIPIDGGMHSFAH